MAKPPANAAGGYIPAQHPDGAAGFTANKPDSAAGQPATPHHHPAPQPPCNESKTFCPSDNKPGEADSNKAYGTFKSAAPAVPGSVADASASRKDSSGSARGGAAQPGDPLRATAEQNNTPGNWTAMSQTTIVLGTDGNTSVQPGAMAGVSRWGRCWCSCGGGERGRECVCVEPGRGVGDTKARRRPNSSDRFLLNTPLKARGGGGGGAQRKEQCELEITVSNVTLM